MKFWFGLSALNIQESDKFLLFTMQANHKSKI